MPEILHKQADLLISGKQHNEKKRLRVLLTGANGQLGNELTERLSGSDGVEVVSTDREDLDITDSAAVCRFLGAGDFDYVVNCAAYTAVDKAENDVELCRRINVDGVVNIVKAIENNKTRLIHISTDFVFDGASCIAYVEEDETHPLNVYGATKREGERAVLSSASDFMIIRTGWLYSSYGHNFVKTILRNALAGKALRVVNDQRGTPTYAYDLAEVIAEIISADRWQKGLYHYSNEGDTTWYDFACEIVRQRVPGAKIEPCSSEEYAGQAERPRFSVLDKTKIRDRLGISIRSWRESLTSCLKKIDINKL